MTNSTFKRANSQDLSADNRFISSLITLATVWNAKLTLHSHHSSHLTSMHKNFDALRQIPILEVAHQIGVEVVKTGAGAYAMRVDGEITSLTLFEKTNTWKRFSGKEQGGVSQGSTLDLVMHINECSLQDAAEFLSTCFL
jgi:sugar phosphate isomerase/epimerase